MSGAFALPDRVPNLSTAQFDRLFDVVGEFSLPGSDQEGKRHSGSGAPGGPTVDEVAAWLEVNWETFGRRDGKLFVRCPWKDGHSCDSGDTEAAWLLSGTEGYARGHFKCLHASCGNRSDQDFLNASGYTAAGFECQDGSRPASAQRRFHLHTISELEGRPPPRWLVKGVLPQADLGVLFGETGSGKSFFALDLVWHVAAGKPWRGRVVRKASVVYICAEGAGGFQSRMQALMAHRGAAESSDLPLRVVTDAPNLLQGDEQLLAKAIEQAGGAELIVVDTLAQTMPGANENSSEDMGKALGSCRRLREATGAMVLLVHHAGKDLSRGARGWSGLKAAADVEIEVSATGAEHMARISKLKDGEGGAAFPFRLNSVVLRIDEDGDEITSCVVEEMVGTSPARGNPRGKWQVAISGCLREAEGGLTVVELIEQVLAKVPGDTPLGGRDRRRDVVLTTLHNMKRAGLLAEIDGQVRMP